MAIDFPNSPTGGQSYTDPTTGQRYVYNSTYSSWVSQGANTLGYSTDTQVIYNDGGLANGSNGLVYYESSNTVFANTINVSGNLNARYLTGNGIYLTGIVSDYSPAFNKANSANYYAYLVDQNTSAAFARANSSNTVVVANVNYVNTAMQAAFAQANNTGPGTNTYLLTVIAGANTAVGGGANNYLLAVIAGANSAVGSGANSVGSAAFAKANTANLYAFLVDANTSAAFLAANTALIQANAANSVAIANVNYVNTAMQAAFAAVNVATANVNYVNTAMQAAFAKANTGAGAGGYYKGNNGDVNPSGYGDIFRVHSNTMSANVYISSGNNSLAAGPITISTGYILQINTGARVAIV